MRKIFTLLLLISTVLTTKAQTPGVMSGKVTDQQNKSIHGATVSLLKAKDSSVVKFTATNKNGHYEFLINKTGSYVVSVTSIGFSKAHSAPFDFTENNSFTIPVITMAGSAKDLNTVVVQSKRPFIETKLDKTVVNVEASPTNAGATALEVLEKSP